MLLALRYGVAVFRSKSREEQRKRDNPLLLKERLNTYSQTMARQRGRMFLELSERVNRDFLKDRTVGNAFRHEMHCFVNDKLQKCQQVGETANVAMREMKQEYQSLSEQERLLRTDAVTPYAVKSVMTPQ